MSNERIITAEEAKALREKWRGCIGPFEAVRDEDGDLVIEDCDGVAVLRIEEFDEYTDAIGHLFASAPTDVTKLSRAVEATYAANEQAAEHIREVSAERLALRADLDATRARLADIDKKFDESAQAFDDLVLKVWRAATGDTHEGPASVEALLTAVTGLRERVEGRSTPPTDEEIAAHAGAGGRVSLLITRDMPGGEPAGSPRGAR